VFYTHIICVKIYAKLQSVIQLCLTLTKLCYNKRDYPENFHARQHLVLSAYCYPNSVRPFVRHGVRS